MPITITADEFKYIAGSLGEARLQNLLLKLYKSKEYSLEKEITSCEHVTSNMISSLFQVAFPSNSHSMRNFLTKCDADKLLGDLVRQSAITGRCWNEVVSKQDPRDTTVSKVLLKVLRKYYDDSDIMQQFINSNFVNSDDVKALVHIEYQSQQLYTFCHQITALERAITQNNKYTLNQLFSEFSIEDIQSFISNCTKNGYIKALQPELNKILQYKQAAPHQVEPGETAEPIVDADFQANHDQPEGMAAAGLAIDHD